MAEVHEIADGIFRIATFIPEANITFNQFLIAPQVPHCWDAILAFEETTGTLMASDLFTQLGEKTSMTSSDMVERTMASHKQLPTYIPVSEHTARVFDRLEALQPGVLACMHGPAFSGDAVRALQDLRTALFSQRDEALTRIVGGSRATPSS